MNICIPYFSDLSMPLLITYLTHNEKSTLSYANNCLHSDDNKKLVLPNRNQQAPHAYLLKRYTILFSKSNMNYLFYVSLSEAPYSKFNLIEIQMNLKNYNIK